MLDHDNVEGTPPLSQVLYYRNARSANCYAGIT